MSSVQEFDVWEALGDDREHNPVRMRRLSSDEHGSQLLEVARDYAALRWQLSINDDGDCHGEKMTVCVKHAGLNGPAPTSRFEFQCRGWASAELMSETAGIAAKNQ